VDVGFEVRGRTRRRRGPGVDRSIVLFVGLRQYLLQRRMAKQPSPAARAGVPVLVRQRVERVTTTRARVRYLRSHVFGGSRRVSRRRMDRWNRR
jgi:hypothetical protein